MKTYKIITLGFALAFASFVSFAQNGIMSPYSRFGYGILRDNATSAQQAMGGVGYGMNSGRQINVMNPASYARIDSLTFLFDMGLDMTFLWSSEGTGADKLSESNIGGGLNYITMQFPVAKRIGMSIGILPYSSVGYAFGNTIDNGYTSRSGSGSINELYVGIAGRIVSTLSVGVNISYLFGSITNDTYAITSSASSSLYSNELRVRDFHIDAGIQYTFPINRNDNITLGFVYSPAKDILGKFRTYAYDVDTSTTESDEEVSSRKYFSMASTYGAGINFRHGQSLMVEADFTYQPWADAKYIASDVNGNLTDAKGLLANRWKVALGAQYQPSWRGSYAKRIQYRAGAYFNRDYMKVRDNNVREFGASVGLGLPVPGFKSVVNLGLGWVHRQAYPSALIKEDYFNITLGINFNESWFRKSRIY